MAKKHPVKVHMNESKQALVEIMREQLTGIAEAMIQQIMARWKRLSPSQRLGAIKDVDTPGTNSYKSLLQTALAIISSEAIAAARKEVPKAKKVKLSEDSVQLGEFENLPPEIQRRIIADSKLIIGTQIADLEKNIFFQFNSSHDETDSAGAVQQDLEDAAAEYIEGAGLESGAGLTAARYVNTARSAFFLDDEVLDEIDAFEFINGDPVTPICQDLAGTIFAGDDPNMDRYQPPLHWNCKSYIQPILKGDLGSREIELLKPSTKKLDDSVQFSEVQGCPSCGHAHNTP